MSALEISYLHDFWIVDSGATHHISNKFTRLCDFHPCSTPSFVSVANGKGAPIKGKGKMNLVSENISSDVLYVPSFPFQLLSVKKLTSSLNCEVLFTPSKVIFQDLVTKKMIGEGFLINGLYYFFPDSKSSKCFKATSSSGHEHLLWHRRLGHPSESTFSKITPSLPREMHDCEICHYSKSTRLPFNLSLSKTTQAFELVHSDVWGPFPSSLDGFKYFVTFIDDFSKVTWLYLLKSKSEVFNCFKDFHLLVVTQFSTHVKILRSDNGTEFTSNDMKNYLISNGILHHTSCVNTSQQNGVAERKNRDLLEKTRALMLQMNVPKVFWSFGVLTAAYLINRLPSRVLDFKCPLEVLQVKQPDISHLKIFGCICFVHLLANHRDKLDPRAVKCIFLGYSQTKKGYKCYDAVHKRLYDSRDVRFAETSPYFESSNQGDIVSELFPFPNVEICPQSSNNVTDQEHETSVPTSDSTNNLSPETGDSSPIESETYDTSQTTNDIPTEVPRRNPPRDRHPPVKFKNFGAYTT